MLKRLATCSLGVSITYLHMDIFAKDRMIYKRQRDNYIIKRTFLKSITQSWLTDEIPDESVRLVDYNIVRRDRNGKKGGGIAIYVHESLFYQVRHD